MRKRLAEWAKALKRDVLAVWLAARDRRVPLGVKLLAACVAAYALSPIDLIPDVIPVLGYLDDLILVPAGLWLVIRLVPPPVMADLRRQAEAIAARPRSPAGAIIVVLIWLAAAAALAGLFYDLAS